MNKNLFIFILFGFILILTTSCAWFSKKEEKQSFYNGLTLLNVNDEASFQDARITGSFNLNFDQIPALTKDWNKLDEIIVYCTNYLCVESDRVAKELLARGFSNVKVYKGGIQEWYQLYLQDRENYPFEGPAKQAFLKKPVQKVSLEDQEVMIIDAVNLSKKLKDTKK